MLIAVLGVLLLLFVFRADSSPSYGGRSLYEWLELLGRDDPANIEQYRAATNAIQILGAEAVPYLAAIIAPEPREPSFIEDAWSEVEDFLDDYIDDLPSFDGGSGPSSQRAAMALTWIQPDGIICLTNLLAKNHHVAGWGLVQNPTSRKWPGVQELLITMASDTDDLDGVYGNQYVWNLSLYQENGDLARLVPLGVNYLTNLSRWHYDDRQYAGAWLLASLVRDGEQRTNLFNAMLPRQNPAYSNAVHEVLNYNSI